MLPRRVPFLIAAITLTACPATIAAQAPAQRDENPGKVEAAANLLRGGNTGAALAAIEAPLAAYDAEYKDEKRDIYCADGPTATLLYMTIAAAAKRSAIAIAPGWCDALFIKGFALVDANRVADGLPYLARASSMAPNNPHYLNELGYAHQALRDWPKSLDAYRRADEAAEFAPADRPIAERTRALRGIGFVLVEQGQWDEAAEMYRKCLKLDPNDAKAKGELRYIAENKPKKT